MDRRFPGEPIQPNLTSPELPASELQAPELPTPEPSPKREFNSEQMLRDFAAGKFEDIK